MRRSLYMLAVVASVALGATSTAVSGNGAIGTLSVTPTTVEAGQSVTVNGTQCPPLNNQVDSASYQGPEPMGMVSWTIKGPQPSNTQIADGTVSNTTGNWTTGPVTIPVGTSPGTYHANAICMYNQLTQSAPSYQSFNAQYDYDPAPFQVVQPSPSPSPSVSPTPTPTQEPVEEEEEPEAKPAKAVRAQPTFTG